MAAYSVNSKTDLKGQNMCNSINEEMKTKVKEKIEIEDDKLSQSVASSSRDSDSGYDTSPCWASRRSKFIYTSKRTAVNVDLSIQSHQAGLEKLSESAQSEDDLDFDKSSFEFTEDSDDDVFLIDFVYSPLVSDKVNSQPSTDTTNNLKLKDTFNNSNSNDNNKSNSNNNNNDTDKSISYCSRTSNEASNNNIISNKSSDPTEEPLSQAKSAAITADCLSVNPTPAVSIQVPIDLVNQRKDFKLYSFSSFISSSLSKLNISPSGPSHPVVTRTISWPFSVLSPLLAKCWQANQSSAKREQNSHTQQISEETGHQSLSNLDRNNLLESSTNQGKS